MGGRCYVLSDAYCRTQKYMMALALGLPCVAYGWIQECIDKVHCVVSFFYLMTLSSPVYQVETLSLALYLIRPSTS